ncbi:hypothetical protein BKA70DRAFT_1289192 [Coprinopsis sp. MPI-PUGE-AT-0042]|nr:hypothetical protein BKA70DRAFT_1289192 [Coprinopsis sp. MPI-PUGE-AT-0042]
MAANILNNLPSEILGEILTHCIADTPPSRVLQDLATLSLVCQLWTHLVNATPTLWTRISFTHLAHSRADKRVSTSEVLRHIQTCISHCEGLPVSLDGKALPDFYTPGSSSAFLAFMQDNSFRWKRLHLTEFFEMNLIWVMFAGRGCSMEDDGGTSPISWSNLEDVKLHFSSSVYSRISCRFDMPKLRSVELTVSSAAALPIPRLACFPLHQIQHLSLTSFANPAKEWREVLETCTSLQELHLGLFCCYIAGSKSVDDEDRPRLVLPLRKLRLTGIRRFEVLVSILFNLSLSDLEELEIDFERGRPVDPREQNLRSLGFLRELILESSCKRLFKLTLNHGRWLEDDLVAFLELIPSLREFAISEDPLSLVFLTNLNARHILPSLDSLAVHIIPRYGPHNAAIMRVLNRFLEERGYATSVGYPTSTWCTRLLRLVGPS